ncbi:unnamed protein product [Ilex paraguariensis]|uniref:Uncharacterized protein n=1 Tax=Ilex paraguariensis TaxID=185542 RepID=A0ABC8SPK6_9AQUA
MTQLRGYNVIYPPAITGGKLISRLFDVFSHLFYKPELQLGKSQLGQNTITITAMQKTIRAKHQDDTSYYTTVTMENHQVNGDVSVDKGKRVVSESDASDSEYEPDCESSECKGSQGEGSQAVIIQAGVSQPAVSQSDVSQGGGSQAVVIQAGVSQPTVSQSNVVCVVNTIYRDLWICHSSAVAFLH